MVHNQSDIRTGATFSMKTRMTTDEFYPFYIPTNYDHHKEVEVEEQDLEEYWEACATLDRIFIKWEKEYNL